MNDKPELGIKDQWRSMAKDLYEAAQGDLSCDAWNIVFAQYHRLELDTIKQTIIDYLDYGQPVQKRRVWFNIAFGIGMPKSELVRQACEELLQEKRIYRPSVGKGHAFSVNHVIKAI